MVHEKSLRRTVITGVFSIFLFLVLLYAANISLVYVDNNILQQMVTFLNHNAAMILMMGFLFFIGEIFGEYDYPINLPAPLFNSAGVVMILALLFNVFEYLNSVIQMKVFVIPESIQNMVYLLFAVIVLGTGYVSILAHKNKTQQKKPSV